MFWKDEEVSVPADAIKYIEEKAAERVYSELYKFEVIELFFEWLLLQPQAVQKSVLKTLLLQGYANVGFEDSTRRKAL